MPRDRLPSLDENFALAEDEACPAATRWLRPHADGLLLESSEPGLRPLLLCGYPYGLSFNGSSTGHSTGILDPLPPPPGRLKPTVLVVLPPLPTLQYQYS